MQIALISVLTLLASAVGTVSGFGTSTIMVPIVLFFLPYDVTLFVVGVIHFFSNVWRILFFKKEISWGLVGVFGTTGIFASYLGARAVAFASKTILSQTLGVFLILYAAFILFNPHFRFAKNTQTAVVGGGVSGFLAGIFGIGGAVQSAVLSSFDLPKAVYLSTGALLALVVDTTRLATYITDKVSIGQELMIGMLVFIPMSFVGSYIGKLIVERVAQNKFRQVVLWSLFIFGIKFLLFP